MGIFTLERAGARTILADAAQKNKKGYKVSGSRNIPSEVVLEQVRRSADADCGPQMMRPWLLRNE